MITPSDTGSGPQLYTALDAPIAGAPTGTTNAPPVRKRAKLRRDEVYGELRRRILIGELPTRMRLAEERVADLLGVSRTPVREALVRLFADRLLLRHPDGGYEVAEPDLRDLRELYELRVTLEVSGVARALETGVAHDVAVLEPLRDSWRRLWSERPTPDSRFVEVDESFHVALSRAAGNAALTEMLEMVNARIRPVRMYDFLTADRITATISQHLGIVEAVLADKLPEGIARMRAHVGVSMEVVERRAQHAITQMALNRGRR